MKKENKAYDKIIREDLKEFVDVFIKNILHINYISKEDKTDKITRTLEREPDFVYLVKTEDSKEFVLHIEFQSTDEADMHFRMFEYSALLYRIHKLPVRQYVVYLGSRKVKQMQTSVRLYDFEFKYNLVSFYNVSYTEMLNSDVAEQVIWAILCNYEGVDARKIVKQILKRLKQLSNGLKLQKYLRQLQLLSVLRKRQKIVIEEEQIMLSTLIDITQDHYYQQGVQTGIKIKNEKEFEKGIEKGIEKGVFDKAKNTLRMIAKGFDEALIIELTQLTEEEIKILTALYNQFGEKAIDHIEIVETKICMK